MLHSSHGYAPTNPVVMRVHRGTHGRRCLLPRLYLKNGQESDDVDVVGVQKDMNPFTRASWYGVEAFGKLFGGRNPSNQGDGVIQLPSSATIDLTVPPVSLQETLQHIHTMQGEPSVTAPGGGCLRFVPGGKFIIDCTPPQVFG